MPVRHEGDFTILGTASAQPIARARSSALLLWGAGIIVFLANCAILVLQLVAGRFLSPSIGMSLATWTAIIGVFMLGISLGNWVGGRVADRWPGARTLGLLLLIGSLSTLATLGLIALLGVGDGAIVRPLPLYPRIALLTLLLCFPPSFVLSMITPLAIKVTLPDVRHTGSVVGLIYALGTLGSLAGNFLTGFVLIPALPINVIVLGVAALLLALAALAWAGGQGEGEVGGGESDPHPRPLPEGEGIGRSPHPAAEGTEDLPLPLGKGRGEGIVAAPFFSMPAACAVVFAASFCTMLIELAASRLLAPYVGVSLFSWTGIIGVVLAGVAVGNFVGGRVADRWPRPAVLGLCLFLGGVGSLAIPLLVEPATAQPFLGIPGFPSLRALGLMPRIVALAATLFFVPVLLLGTISPQVIRLAITDLGHAGRTAGRIYAWSTAGAIVGTFAAGWALISLLGVNLLSALAGLGLMTLALVVGLWRGRPTAALAGGVGLAVAGIVGLALLPRLDADANPALRPLRSLVTSGCTQETNYFCIRTYFQPEKDGGVMVLVLDHLVHSYVKVNDPAYLGYEHEQVQVDLTHLAATRAGERPNILLIGGGGYTYPRWVEAFVPGAAIDVVEIDPGVTETAYRDLGLKRDTRIRSYNLDGRQFVQEMAPKGSYQLVVQDAVNDLSVPYHIMTKEYNDRVKQVMKEDGVYLLSVIDLYQDGQLMRSSLRTLMQSFKEVRLLAVTPTWSSGGAAVYVIYASDRPFDLEEVRAAARARGATARTVAQPVDEMRAYVADGPPIILTDQYAPVDNLISILFSRRNA